MQGKGLCVTCNNIKTCTFTKRWPVMQCEEFCTDVKRPRCSKGKRPRKI